MPTKIRIKEINFSLRKDIYQEATANIKLHSETSDAFPIGSDNWITHERPPK